MELECRPLLEGYLEQEILLKGLSEQEMRELWQVAVSSPASTGVLEMLTEETQGNPLALRTLLRKAATERPFSSPLDHEKRRGTFACAGCGLPLYASDTKFDSGTGWPSFFRPLPNAVVNRRDLSLGMARTEVLCRRCGGHLGHVFDDGPKPTGLRYCMNGLALRFIPA